MPALYSSPPLDRSPCSRGHLAIRPPDDEQSGHARIGVPLNVAVVHPRPLSYMLAGYDLEPEGVGRTEGLVVYRGRRLVEARRHARPVVGPAMSMEMEGVEVLAVTDHDELDALADVGLEDRR